jgi:hypothetical protein
MAVYHLGQKAPESGIYSCANFWCSERKTIPRGKKLPPCRKGHKDGWELQQQTTKSRKKSGWGIFD